jgi:hypothetical protein
MSVTGVAVGLIVGTGVVVTVSVTSDVVAGVGVGVLALLLTSVVWEGPHPVRHRSDPTTADMHPRTRVCFMLTVRLASSARRQDFPFTFLRGIVSRWEVPERLIGLPSIKADGAGGNKL